MDKERKLIRDINTNIRRMNVSEDKVEMLTKELYKLKTGKDSEAPYRLTLYELGISI